MLAGFSMDETTGCPVAASAPPSSHLAPGDELVLAMPRRMVVQYGEGENGARELRLFYGAKEISFDEPELFTFGETLARQSRFRAGDATQWGEGYAWEKVGELFEQLIEEGVLLRGENAPAETSAALDRSRPSPLPPATCPFPRSWTDAEEITRELAGRPVETGYLELFVPIFRVAHMTMDADGRHVGEANVFPPAMRTETPTEWMTCIYPGSRYMAGPMNVTALKAMREHWPQIMAALTHVRAAYLRRFPEAEKGWTVGHLERFATSVLCVVTWQIARHVNPVPNGALHPALSSLFRVTDGLRMVMHHMLFIPVGEPTLSPDEPMAGQRVFDYAERNFSFHSAGVCAGPAHMIKEFLGLVVEGEKLERYATFEFEPAVATALADVDTAIDYALLGLQAYACAFSFYPLATRAYARLAGVAAAATLAGASGFAAFDARMAAHLRKLETSPYLARESWRADRDHVYADMYEQCGRGLVARREPGAFARLIAPEHSREFVDATARMTKIARQRLDPERVAASHVVALVECLMDFVARARAILREAVATQGEINRLLGRPAPTRPFNARDFDVHIRIQGERPDRLPFILDEIEAALGARFEIEAERMDISETGREGAAT